MATSSANTRSVEGMPASTDWVGDVEALLPHDRYAGTLVGRVWNAVAGGPSPAVFTEEGVFDISGSFATMRDLCETAAPAEAAREAMATGARVGSLTDLVANTPDERRDPTRSWLLTPVDLQSLKAAGVTFAVSMIERVIEERTKGEPVAAASIRQSILAEIGADLRTLKPGSPEALALKRYLTEQGLWSQYLEVGIGPDAEIFTKGQALSALGGATALGVLESSTWNNPEPEVAIVIASTGRIVGATLGNDVNLRDVEGRSALLLPQAKDNNASCGLGPFIRMFDSTFDLDTVRSLQVTLKVTGTDGFVLTGASQMSEISRDPEELVRQLMGEHHQYPDGAVLLLGTMFAPIDDRDVAGQGFTHKPGDVVRISAAELGTLVNRIQTSESCEPWTFGIAALMQNLARRGLL